LRLPSGHRSDSAPVVPFMPTQLYFILLFLDLPGNHLMLPRQGERVSHQIICDDMSGCRIAQCAKDENLRKIWQDFGTQNSLLKRLLVDWKMSVITKGEIRTKRKSLFILTMPPYTTRERSWDNWSNQGSKGSRILYRFRIWPRVTSFFWLHKRIVERKEICIGGRALIGIKYQICKSATRFAVTMNRARRTARVS
jgi:hypothetical protein